MSKELRETLCGWVTMAVASVIFSLAVRCTAVRNSAVARGKVGLGTLRMELSNAAC